MSVTTIAELREKSGGTEISVPGFMSGEVLTFKVKRPSLMDMAMAGKIPNPLMAQANKLFKAGSIESVNALKDGEEFKELAEVMKCVVKSAMVEPTLQELKDNDIQLTDVQILYIYNFVMSGVDSLQGFRKEQEHN